MKNIDGMNPSSFFSSISNTFLLTLSDSPVEESTPLEDLDWLAALVLPSADGVVSLSFERALTF